MSARFPALSDHSPTVMIGGKACSLQQMHALGLRIPEGVVVTAPELAGFTRPFAQWLQRQRNAVDAHAPSSAEQAAEQIRTRIEHTALPPDFEPALQRAARTLGPGPFIVRSSALGEDGREASFAGQLDSIFPVAVADLAAAVKRCWASAFSARSLSYQANIGVQLRGVAVIVQRLIYSAHAGVLFSDGIDLRGEYCDGYGEALVSGRITPGRFRIARRSAKGEHVATMSIDASYGDGRPPLSARAIHELAHGAVALENRHGVAMDIEWATDQDGTLYFVQARPVTAPLTALWSNTNICENFPGVVTPLLYSIARRGYHHYFRNLALAFGLDRGAVDRQEDAFRGIIGVHCGRLYYNLSNIHAVFRLAPFGDTLVNAFNLFVGAEQSETATARSLVSEVASLLKMGALGTHAFSTLPARLERFERRADAFAADYRPEALARMSEQQLEAGVQRFMDIREHRWIDASLCDGAAMLSYSALKRWVEQMALADEGALHSLLTGLDHLASSAPITALYAVADRIRDEKACREALISCAGYQDFIDSCSPPIRRALEDYLERWGFRGSGELMLTEPSFQEQPELLLPILGQYVRSAHASPQQRLAQQKAERLAKTAELRRRLPRWQRPLFDQLLSLTHHAISYRERARLKQALLYSRLRRIVLALGNKLAARDVLGARDDVFFLSVEELCDLVHGRCFFASATAALIGERQAQWKAYDAIELPETFTLPIGATASEPMRALARRQAVEGELLGVAASSGVVRGKAAVLRGLEEAHTLSEHDLLVTKQTDPGWAPLFFLIDGLVMERGGMLSHGSILAREFGIPSVVGIPDVTRTVQHGSEIEVDGDRGRVRCA